MELCSRQAPRSCSEPRHKTDCQSDRDTDRLRGMSRRVQEGQSPKKRKKIEGRDKGMKGKERRPLMGDKGTVV